MECKNCGLRIQETYLYCPKCGAPSYSSLYAELIKVDYFISECDTWMEEGLMDAASVLPIKERYLIRKQELLTLLQSSEEIPPIQKEDILRQLKERVIEKSFEKTKRIVEEDVQEVVGEPMKVEEFSRPLSAIEKTSWESIQQPITEETEPSNLLFSPLRGEKSEDYEPFIPASEETSSSEASDVPKPKIFLSSGSEKTPGSSRLREDIASPSITNALVQKQMVVTFLSIIGVFSAFFISLQLSLGLPTSYYAPLLMVLGATGVQTGYYLTTTTGRSQLLRYSWTHPLALGGYTLTFLALLLSLKDLNPGVMAITLTLGLLLYVLSAYVYKSSLFVYLSALDFGFLYLIALFGLIAFSQGESFQWFPLSLPATCFAFIPLTVFWTYLERQYSTLEAGKFSKPLHQLALALSSVILLTTLAMLYYESISTEGTFSLQSLFFPSQETLDQITLALAVFLTYSVLYAIYSYLYKDIGFLHLTNILLILSTGIWINYMRWDFALPFILSLIFLVQFFTVQFLQTSGVSKLYLVSVLKVPMIASLVPTLILLLDSFIKATQGTEIPSYSMFLAFLTVGVFYLLVTQIYPNYRLVYMAWGVFALGSAYIIPFLDQATLATYGITGGIFSLLSLAVAFFYERNLRISADLDLYGEKTSVWQENTRLYVSPITNSAIFVSILALIIGWSDSRVLALLGVFYLFLTAMYPSKYQIWMYIAGIMFIGSVFVGWVTPLPFTSWDSPLIFMALALFILAYLVQINRETLCQVFSLPDQNYHQPLFNLSLLLFYVFAALYVGIRLTNPTDVISDFSTLLPAIIFCGFGFFIKEEVKYLACLFVITFILNFSLWHAFLEETHFGYLSLSSALLSLGWLGITYLITRSSSDLLLEQFNLSISGPVRQTISRSFYPLIFLATLLSLSFGLRDWGDQLSFWSLLTFFIVGGIYTCYAHIFRTSYWLYGANLAVDAGVFYFISWFTSLWASGGNPYLITSYLGFSAVVLCTIWTYLGKRYETQAELPDQAHVKDFAFPHFVMAWVILPLFVILMSGLFLWNVPSPQLWGFGLHLLTLIGLTVIYICLAVTEKQDIFLFLSEFCLAFTIFFMYASRPDYFVEGRITLWLVLVSFVLMEVAYLTKKYQVHMLIRLAHYTALLLPLMSIILLKIFPLQEVNGYGVLSMLTIAGFYGWASYLLTYRIAFYLGLFLANIGLFMFWFWNHLSFSYTFQLYLIPVLVSVLSVVELNKHFLSPISANNIRFFITLAIFLVSSVEMGLWFGESWRADFLTALCFLGILLGLAWRVKAFLMLGVIFLCFNLSVQILFYLYDNSWLMTSILIGIALLSLISWAIQRKKQTVRYILEDATQELSTWE
jgi:hypothetical protein